MSSLAMIEPSSTTTIIESKTASPPYTEFDEKDLLLDNADAEPSDLEITMLEHKPITAKIHTTIGHLHRVGGFFARWRGMGMSILYNLTHACVNSLVSELFGFGLIGSSATYVLSSVMLARMHMAWTHAMIAYPNSKRWFREVPAIKSCRPVYLSAFVYAAAEQVTLILPLAVAFAVGVIGPHAEAQRQAVLASGCPRAMLLLSLRYLAVPATYAIVGLAVLFPASVTLTRIEAALLPEGEEPIVPFDKSAVMGGIDSSARGASRRMFVQAWRSFDRASRWRLVKLYVKMAFAQFVVILVTVHLIIFQLYVLGAERMAIFFRSASAQVKMMAMDAQQSRGDQPLQDFIVYATNENGVDVTGH